MVHPIGLANLEAHIVMKLSLLLIGGDFQIPIAFINNPALYGNP